MPEKVLTTSNGQLVTEALIETVTEYMSSSTPATSHQVAVATTTPSAIATSSLPSPTPSFAIIIYRRDVCIENHGVECSSTAYEYDILPGQSVQTCEGQANYQAPNYSQPYPRYEGGITSNYPINIGPFTTHKYADCTYNGTYQVVGKLNGPLFEVQGSIPTATAQICSSATDTPVVYVEW